MSRTEVGILVAMTFIGFVMFGQCINLLWNSISNSGEINILSLICIFTIDQAIIRSGAGILLLSVIKILDVKAVIDVKSNIFVVYLCHEEIQKAKRHNLKRKVKVINEGSLNQLKPIEDFNFPKAEEKHIGDIDDNFFDLGNLQPEPIHENR